MKSHAHPHHLTFISPIPLQTLQAHRATTKLTTAPCTTITTAKQTPTAPSPTRRSILHTAGLTSLSLLLQTAIPPHAARATPTLEEAVDVLRTVRSSVDVLAQQAVNGDLAEMRRALRAGALSRLRTSVRAVSIQCGVADAGNGDGDGNGNGKRDCKSADRAAKRVIVALEAADNAALRAEREQGSVADVTKRLDEFASALDILLAIRASV